MAASDLDAARVAALLRGTAVEFLRSPHVPLTFSSQTVAVLKDSLVYLTSEVKQGAGVARKSDLTERPTSPSFSATACAALLRAMAPDKPGEDHSNVCESISQFHRRLVGAGNHEDLALWPKIVGSGDDASTFVLARKDEPSVTLRYVASGTGGVLFHRAILVNHADDLTVAVALGPFGEVLGGRSTIFLLPGPEHDDLLYAKEVYFDAQWVALQAKRLPLGSRREALSLLDHYASRASLAPLPTDGMRAAKPGPIVAMVVEQALDVRDPALVQRLHLDESALIGMTRSRMPTFALSLFGSGRSAPLSLQEFNFPGMSATTSHGALVASVMAADLPDAKIGLLPAGIISQLPAPGGLARAAAIIRAQKPRVVNISMGFSATIPDCEAAFGPLFDQFRDSVAFIVALGNDASSNVADICPAGIGHRFENVITVAGTDHDGDIDRDSNFGASSATVAAPFAPTFRWPLVPATGPPRAGGTSFAAPAVANAALRLLLAQPGLRPSEVKALLMQACAPRDLEVACGGALDLAKLDGLERLLQTTHVEAGEQSTAAP